nr:hypothetical protein [uncultured Flavobacterium sp.]
MKTFLENIREQLNSLPYVYTNGISLYDKSYLKRLNNQLKAFNVEDKFSFTPKERRTTEALLKGTMVFNTRLHAELILINNKRGESQRLTLPTTQVLEIIKAIVELQ